MEIAGVVAGPTPLCLAMVRAEEVVKEDQSCASVNTLDTADTVLGTEESDKFV